MTKKDYIRAAELVQGWNISVKSHYVDRMLSAKKGSLTDIRALEKVALELENSFVDFFQDDNPRFDEKRFRTACKVKP